jgi:hypothetical protein
MGLAVRVEDAGRGIVAHAASAVLVADAFKRDALLEVSVEWNGGACVAGLLEDVDPTVFEALEGLDVVWRVGELNPPGRCVCDGLDWLVRPVSPDGWAPTRPGCQASTESGVALWSVTRLSGSGRSSVVSHHGTAWCFIPSRTKPGVSGGASPFIISK